MADILELWEQPDSKETFLFIGWRQWADAGSVSSELPLYQVKQLGGKQIGKMDNDLFYIFQIPGTHDLLRPVIRYVEGLPVELETPHTELYFAGNDNRGYLFLVGDEPHTNIEKYTETILELVKKFKIRRIIGFGGVYGEVPFDKKRTVSCTYSLEEMKPEVNALGVSLSDYHGGASIGSFLCKRAGEQKIEYVSFYAFVPAYDFSELGDSGGSIRIENDYSAWLSVMERVKTMLKLDWDLTDLESKALQLGEAIEEKVSEIDKANPEMGIRDYFQRVSENFVEIEFNPSADFWEEKLRGLFDKFDSDEEK